MIKILIRQMRIAQWPKNLLVVIPLFTSHQIFDPDLWVSILVSWFSFCFISSAGYQINDIVDVAADKQHPDNSQRPFAQGQLSRRACLIISFLSLIAALMISSTLSNAFTATIIIYAICSLLYSFVFKPIMILDVLMLAFLYLLRVYGGAIIVGVLVSNWLLFFSSLLFLALALMKRFLSLQSQNNAPFPQRHSYRKKDAMPLLVMGLVANISAIVIFMFYIQAPEITLRFSAVEWMYGVWVIFLFWSLRLWYRVSRNQVKEDIAGSIIKDKTSWFLWILALLFFIFAL